MGNLNLTSLRSRLAQDGISPDNRADSFPMWTRNVFSYKITGTDRKFPLSCELLVGTNGSNTKETFLSWESGNQPLTFILFLDQHTTCISLWDHLYLYSAYAAHYVYFIWIGPESEIMRIHMRSWPRRGEDEEEGKFICGYLVVGGIFNIHITLSRISLSHYILFNYNNLFYVTL